MLNGLNPNLGNIAYSGKFSKFGEKKCLIRRKKEKSLSKIAAPGPTSSVSFEAVLSNKDENRIGQLFIYEKSEPYNIKNDFLGNFS